MPIHVEKGYPSPWDKGDFLRIYSGEFCPNQKLWQAQNLQRPDVKEIINYPAFQAAISAVNKAYNITSLNFEDISAVIDNSVCMIYEGRSVNPIWTTPSVNKNSLDAMYAIDLYVKLFYTEQQLATTATGYFN